MNICISPARLNGTIAAIASKSEAHRALICAAFADKPTTIRLTSTSADIETTIHVLQTLGAGISRKDFSCTVVPAKQHAGVPEKCTLFCAESGSTARFMLPVAAAVCGSVLFTGSGRLPERPMTALSSALRRGGCAVSADYMPLSVTGKLHCGVFEFPGNISSQFITGMLLALPLVEGGGEIRITTPLESSAYVDITLAVLKKFGVAPKRTAQGFVYSSAQPFRSPEQYSVEGDWSNSAFWLCASFLGSTISVTGLNPSSFQGDKAISVVLQQFSQSGTVCIDVRNIPDLVPVLAVAACGRCGKTQFSGCARLRLKESDRIASVCAMIRSLGGIITADDETMTITGNGTLCGGTVDGMNDHRIVMAAAVASTICCSEVTILGAQAVDKSYPSFWDDFKLLGGTARVIDVR